MKRVGSSCEEAEGLAEGRNDSGKTEDRKPHLYTDLWQPGTELCGSPEKKRMCQAERARICRKWAWSIWRVSKGLRWGPQDDQNGTQPHRMAVLPVYVTELGEGLGQGNDTQICIQWRAVMRED